MKRFLLTALFVLIGSLAFAQERIAVFPFEDRNNVYTKDELDSFYVEFSNEFRNKTDDRRFTVLARDDLEKLINMEAKFQLSDYSSKEKTAELQRVLNAQQILYCLILKVGNEIRITVSRRSFPELSVLRGGKTISVTNKNQLFGKIPELVQAMVSEIGGGGTTAQTNPTGNSTPAQTNPSSNTAQQYDPESDFKAELMEGGKSVRITSYRGEKWTVRIPPSIQGIPVTHIGDEAFSHTNITNVIIPNSVTSIGESAFSYCISLTGVTILDSVTSIGGWAFYHCTSFTNVTIPNSVTSIGESAFSYCENLTSINVAVDNTAYTAVNGILYNKDRSVLHTYPAGKKGNFIIPNGVTIIWNYAFFGCTNLTGVTIPNSVISIGNEAFQWCHNLASVTISNSVTSIGDMAFNGCNSLTSVTIPDSVTSMGRGTFSECSKLSRVNIGNGVVSLDSYPGLDTFGTFTDCTSLSSITIGNRVTSIGKEAFSRCENLTSITIPNSVTSIEDLAFWGCDKLTSVTFQGTITWDKFSDKAFDGNLRQVFYSNNSNGTPGTYRTSNPGRDAKWRKL